ncbi:MAG: MBL fold metallo-hydrolase [Firmicutes bacterium]|nr:MBL fold metallo-hydrolase [Bacillota bacterium]
MFIKKGVGFILNKIKFVLLILLLILALIIIFFTFKFYKDKEIVNRQMKEINISKFQNVDSVKNLSILPIVEYDTKNSDLLTEAGVSYLIKADNRTILFDVGFNKNNEHPSILLKNMKYLNININEIDDIFISHNHPDHTGGHGLDGTFSLSKENVKLENVIAYTPEKMEYNNTKIKVVNKPKRLSKGIYSTGTISRAIWLMGITKEQTLAINLENKGIVLIIGCGHPSIKSIIKRAEDIFDEPIYGVIGGLHYPISNKLSYKSIVQNIAAPKLPWKGYKKSEVYNSIDLLIKKDVKVVGISPHDSSKWTINQFKDRFKSRYKNIVVGKKIDFKIDN